MSIRASFLIVNSIDRDFMIAEMIEMIQQPFYKYIFDCSTNQSINQSINQSSAALCRRKEPRMSPHTSCTSRRFCLGLRYKLIDHGLSVTMVPFRYLKSLVQPVGKFLLLLLPQRKSSSAHHWSSTDYLYPHDDCLFSYLPR